MAGAQDGTFTCLGHMEGTVVRNSTVPCSYECILGVRPIPTGQPGGPPQA